MNLTENPTARALVSGLVAGIAVLVGGYAAGEGIAVVEWLLALSTFLTVAFGLTTVANRAELKRTRAEMTQLGSQLQTNVDEQRNLVTLDAEKRHDEILFISTAVDEHKSEVNDRFVDLEGQVSDVEAGLSGMNSDANRRPTFEDILENGKIPFRYLPALALTNVSEVNTMADLTTLEGADEGDVAIVRDNGFGTTSPLIYTGTTWVLMKTPVDDVVEAQVEAAVHRVLDGLANS